jgi:hypothetical protein
MGPAIDPLADPRVQAAIAEIQALVLRRFPDASFAVWVGMGEDTAGVYLEAAIHGDDLMKVADLYSDRLVDVQVDDGVPIRVVPVRSHERFAELFGGQPVTAPAASPA